MGRIFSRSWRCSFRRSTIWIDWARPYEFLDAELHQITGDADIGRRYADRLVKVYSVEGTEVWLLIHIEVQGRADERFPARMFQYYYRIYDRYGDVEILSLAVVTHQTLDPESPLGDYQRECDGYGLCFRFRVQVLRDWSEATLIELGGNQSVCGGGAGAVSGPSAVEACETQSAQVGNY